MYFYCPLASTLLIYVGVYGGMTRSFKFIEGGELHCIGADMKYGNDLFKRSNVFGSSEKGKVVVTVGWLCCYNLCMRCCRTSLGPMPKL